MGLQNVGNETLVFQVIDGCMCEGCFEKVEKILKKIDKKISIGYDKSERKLTIQGNNLVPNTMITELGHIWKNVKLVTEQNAIIDQSVLADEASAVVVHRAPFYNQVVDLSSLSMASHFYPKPDHEHEFELKHYAKRFKCDGCKEKGHGPRYQCKHCGYELHENCMNPEPTISHALFKGLLFKFSREKPSCMSILCREHNESCEACGNEIHGYSYSCEDNNLYLHPSCVKFTEKICIQGETFVLKKKATHKCFWCIGNKNKANFGWSYVSDGNKEQLHVNCLAKITLEAWEELSIGGSDDAYIAVLHKRLNWGIVDNKKKNKWSEGGKILKMVMVFARTIIGILLGDPTVILASMLVEVLK